MRVEREPLGQLVGWAMVAAVNAVFVAVLSFPPGGWGVRALHHAYDSALLLAAGLVAALLCSAFRRLPIRRAWFGYAALAAASICAGFFTLDDDLFGFSVDYGGGHPTAFRAVVVAVSALLVPAAAWLGTFLARPRIRWLACAVGLTLSVANNVVLRKGYPGIHLYIAVAAATLVGSALGTGARWVQVRAAAAGRPWLPRATLAGSAVGVVCAIAILPPQAVLLELYRLDGQVAAPLVASLHAGIGRSAAHGSGSHGEWFENRSGKPAVPPSPRRLVRSDSVIIMITVDSVLARVLHDEANRAKLPFLFALRDSSVDFLQARAPASGTTTTLSSLFTCKYVSQLDWASAPGIKRQTPYKDDSIRLPEALSKVGVTSVHFVSYPPLGARGGIGRGFTEEKILRAEEGQRFALSTQVVPAMIKRLKKYERGPLFMYAHLMDPHHPHDAGALKEGDLFERYLSEIALVDHWLAELDATIGALNLRDRTVLIVSADHGEGFGKHDTPHHNINLYEELIRVPLMVRVPGLAPRKVSEPVTLLDLPPTILDLWQLSTPGGFMGQSLVPLLADQRASLTRPIVAEIPRKQAMLFGHYKLIRDSKKKTVELYDLDADPAETNNVFDQAGNDGQAKLEDVLRFFEAHARKGGEEPTNVE